jgi:hypothetical protein
MSRWHARLAELRGDTAAFPAHVQIVQNVQNPARDATFEHIEHIEQRAEPDEQQAGAWTETCEERAAVVEYDGGAPRAWAEGFARLDPSRPPADVPQQRWLRFIDDCGRFLDGGWATRAAAFGWGPLDLFGCDRERPFVRPDHKGLLWLVNGGTIIELNNHGARIQTKTGAPQSYERRPVEVGRVVLAWELRP